MASTGKYQTKDGTFFWVRYRTPDGTQPKVRTDDQGKRFTSDRAAKRYGDEHEVLARRNPARIYDRDANVVMTVAEYAWYWHASRFTTDTGEERRDRTPGSKRWNEGMIRNHIDGTPLGNRRLVEVTRTEVERWIAGRSVHSGGTLANSTLKMAVGLLRTVFDTAVTDRVLPHSPVPGNKKIQWPRDGEEAIHAEQYVALSVEQVQALADAFPARYRAMPLVQAGLGLRIGELLALREEDILWREGWVVIDWQFNDSEKQRGKGPGGRARPKSRHSRRRVPLPEPVAEVLREHIAAFPSNDEHGSLFCKERSRRPHATGGPIGHQYYGQQLFKKAMRAAGLPECSTHDLRHHYATELLHQGVDETVVAKYLGHADAGLVISTYGHAKEGTSDDVRAAVTKSWSEAAEKRQRHLRAV